MESDNKIKRAVVIDGNNRLIIDYEHYNITFKKDTRFYLKGELISFIPYGKTVVFQTPEPDDIIIYPYVSELRKSGTQS